MVNRLAFLKRFSSVLTAQRACHIHPFTYTLYIDGRYIRVFHARYQLLIRNKLGFIIMLNAHVAGGAGDSNHRLSDYWMSRSTNWTKAVPVTKAFDIFKFWADDGAWRKVKWSPRSFICVPWLSVWKLMSMHPIIARHCKKRKKERKKRSQCLDWHHRRQVRGSTESDSSPGVCGVLQNAISIHPGSAEMFQSGPKWWTGRPTVWYLPSHYMGARLWIRSILLLQQGVVL